MLYALIIINNLNGTLVMIKNTNSAIDYFICKKLTKINNTIRYENVLQEQYINYFTLNYINKDSEIMNKFLLDMERECDKLIGVLGPISIIKNALKRLDLNDTTQSIMEKVLIAVDNDLIRQLSAVENFAILWLLSCRNIFIFSNDLYCNMSEQGIIGKLLVEIQKNTSN